jgi:hypothetical protein
MAGGLLQLLTYGIQDLYIINSNHEYVDYVHEYKYEYKPNKNRFNVIDKRH